MFGSGLFGSPRAPKYSLGPVNVAFPTPQRLPPGVGVGSLAPGRRHLGQVIEDKTAQGLRAAGLYNHAANRWAGKLFGAFNDLTPLGNVTGADDGARMAYQGLTHGNLKTGLLGAGMFAASVLPYGGKVKRPLRELMGDTTGAIRAWHGSPHDFDKFEWSPRTRGTGEGVQAYGDGLYFAENKAVAKGYQNDLTKGLHAPMTLDGQDIDHRGANSWVKRNEELWANGDPIGGIIAEMLGEAQRYNIGSTRSLVTHIKKNPLPGQWRNPDLHAQALKQLGKRATIGNPKGHLYEVNINAEPEDFLDWDSAVSGAPRDAMRAVGFEPVTPNRWQPLPRYEPKEPRQWLNGDTTISETPDGFAYGINGKMLGMAPTLDEAKRAAPVYAQPLKGSEAYHKLGDTHLARSLGIAPETGLMGAGGVSDALRRQGIPGIRFLDQGSRGAGNGTSNFVVFDDSLIDILKKY